MVVDEVLDGRGDVIIAHGVTAADRVPVTVKLARTDAGSARLRNHAGALAAFAAAPASAALVPRLVRVGDTPMGTLTIESRLPGRPVGTQGTITTAVATRCLDALAVLHAVARADVRPDAALLDAWVDDHVEVVRGHDLVPVDQAALDAVRDELRSALDRPLVAARVHGDFSPGNVLADERLAVSGIIDFEHTRAVALPDTDHVQFALTCAPPSVALGELVERTLVDGRAHPAIAPIAALALDAAPNALGLRTLVLHAWLVNLADDIRKWGRALDWGPWAVRDIADVVAAAARTAPD